MEAALTKGETEPLAPPSALAAAIAGARNERGIPSAVFLDDIASFLAAHGGAAAAPDAPAAAPGVLAGGSGVEELYGELNTLHSKYKLMESQLEEGRSRAAGKVPELEASLEAVALLVRTAAAGPDAAPASAWYNLSDNVFVRANVAPRGVVAVWLGAGVMLEYSYAEARALLGEQLAAAQAKVRTNSADLAFLRDQIITTEVNIARVYNYSVKSARKAKMAAAAAAAAAQSAAPAPPTAAAAVGAPA